MSESPFEQTLPSARPLRRHELGMRTQVALRVARSGLLSPHRHRTHAGVEAGVLLIG